MMPVKVLKIACICFGILFLLFSILTVFSVSAEMERINNSGGIIGGMDAPMVEFLVHTSPLFYPAILSFLLFAAAGISLLLFRILKKSLL